MQILENFPLRELNTFHIKADAKYFASFETLNGLEELLSIEKIKTSSKLILGGGSNLLFTKNYAGAVLKNNLFGKKLQREDNDFFYVKAGAGENWHAFVLWCLEHNYAGVENLSLIPGNVGASPMQNIGAYGVEIKDVFYELEAYHIEDRKLHVFTAADCKFGYRESVFKRQLRDQYIICSVTFRLRKNPVLNTSYGAIEKELEAMAITTPTIQSISQAVCNIRRSKLPDPAKIGNAGSFFKNPVIATEQFNQLKTKFPDIVGYPGKTGETKVAAGWLIEKAGWKGKRFGDAGVHENQALVLVNYHDASGNEIHNLSTQICESVASIFGIVLETEVNLI